MKSMIHHPKRWALMVLASVWLSSLQGNDHRNILERLRDSFYRIENETKVPAILLMAIAYQASRWIFRPADTGMDGEFGIMGLRTDPNAPNSLKRAIALLGVGEEAIRTNPELQIKATALMLRQSIEKKDPQFFSRTYTLPEEISYFTHAIWDYYGFDNPSIAKIVIDELNRFLEKGFVVEHPQAQPVPIKGLGYPNLIPPTDRFTLQSLLPSETIGAPLSDEPCSQYTDGWEASPNYSSRRGAAIDTIVIHTTECSFQCARNAFTNPNGGGSAHYVIRSSDGFVLQMVRLRYKAWHARNANPTSIGLEHEAKVAYPSYYTDIMHQKSAALVQCLLNYYNLQADRVTIRGHVDLPLTNTHFDPGIYWKWDYYFELLTGKNPAYQAKFLGATYVQTMTSGQREMATLRFQNEGTQRWDNDEVFLVTDDPMGRQSEFYDPDNWISPSQITAADTVGIKPGNIGEFSFNLKAPVVDAMTTFYEKFTLKDPNGNPFGNEDQAVELVITVFPQSGSSDPLQITTTSLPDGVELQPYNDFTLQAIGGVGARTFSITSGTLPNGMSFSSDGTLSGTPTENGNFNLTFQVSDSASPPNTASQTLTLTIQASTSNEPLAFATDTTLPKAKTGEPYAYTIQAVGGNPPYTFSIENADPNLSWLSIDSETGELSSPVCTGNVGSYSLTIKVSDSLNQSISNSFSVTIDNGIGISPISLSSASLPNATIGSIYSHRLSAVGGNGAIQYAFHSTSKHPSWLTLSEDGHLSGLPYGSPAIYNQIVIQAVDSANPNNIDIKTYSLVVEGKEEVPDLKILTRELDPFSPGQDYRFAIRVAGGTPPYSFDRGDRAHDIQSDWPSWLSIDEETGELIGTPPADLTTTRYNTIAVEVMDSGNPNQVQTKTFVLLSEEVGQDQSLEKPPEFVGCTCNPQSLDGKNFSSILWESLLGLYLPLVSFAGLWGMVILLRRR